jgi:hypothetical protein
MLRIFPRKMINQLKSKIYPESDQALGLSNGKHSCKCIEPELPGSVSCPHEISARESLPAVEVPAWLDEPQT